MFGNYYITDTSGICMLLMKKLGHVKYLDIITKVKHYTAKLTLWIKQKLKLQGHIYFHFLSNIPLRIKCTAVSL